VPVKARSAGKQRLAAALPGELRTTLIRTMLARVLGVLDATPGIERVLVISPDRDQLPPSVPVFADAGTGLNAALEASLAQLPDAVQRLLIVSADLPLLESADLAALMAAAGAEGIALAPDHAGTGTNALFLRLPSTFRFQFGAGSFLRHVSEAARLGAPAVTVARPGLAFDIDEPADLARLRAMGDPRYAFLD
jgi:2-phospho-L-lactate guanylyltransferase